MADLNTTRSKETADTQETGDGKDGDILAIKEVTIEEMAIDGICGVY